MTDHLTRSPAHTNPSAACADCRAALPDLLLDPQSARAASARAHLPNCTACRDELASLQTTLSLLDTWAAPEPSAWFDTRMLARLREAEAAAPESWWERMRSRLLFNTGRQFRPLAAGALAAVLLVGGGTAVTLSGVLHPTPEVSATVQDLQILDRNDQALQTMDQLLDDGGPDDDSSAAPTT